jgi:hypothetical protein
VRVGVVAKDEQALVHTKSLPGRGRSLRRSCPPVTGSVLDDEVLDELLARPIEPVKVLEEENGRLPGAARAG